MNKKRWATTAGFTLLLALALLMVIKFRPAHVESPTAPATAPVVDVNELKAKAERGDADAQVAFADILLEGGPVKRNYQEAVKWFRLAAEQGNAEARNKLGMLHQAGQGVPQDDTEAARLFRLAAEQGHVGAEYNLGSAYGAGRGVAQDSAEAARWYLKAAEHGDAYAQYNVAQRYELGRGVTVDAVEAYKWFELAARGNVDDAKIRAARLKPQLSAAQLREAQDRIKAFVAKGARTKSNL